MQGHRGAIKVYSELGKGTTFKLLFPAVDEPAVERAQTPQSTTWQGSGGRIRLTLLDLAMPRLDGEETFRQLRLIDPEVRVVMMSGYNAQTVTTQFVGNGLAGFVQKPFRADDLEAQVRAVLDR